MMAGDRLKHREKTLNGSRHPVAMNSGDCDPAQLCLPFRRRMVDRHGERDSAEPIHTRIVNVLLFITVLLVALAALVEYFEQP